MVMPMDKESNKSLIVGIVTFLMMIVLAVMIIWQSDIFRKVTGYELVGRFDHIGGLIDGGAIRYRGYTVGHVIDISPLPQHIDVRFFLDGSIKIPDDSMVKIMFDGLVGENYIQIEPGIHETSFYKDGDIINGKSGSDLANFIDLGSQNLVQAEEILVQLKTFLDDPHLLLQIKNTVKNIHDASGYLTKLTQGDLSELLNNANDSVQSINSLASSLNNQESIALLHESIKNFHKTTEAVAEIQALTGAISDADTIAKMNTIISNFELVSKDLQSLFSGFGKKTPLSTFRNLNLSSTMHIAYAPTKSNGYFDSMFGLDKGRLGLLGGIGNRTGVIKLQHFQQTYRLSSLLRSRFGIMYNSEGVGLDFYPRSTITLSANLYDFENYYYSFSTGYLLREHLNLEVIYRKDSQMNQGGIDFGINLDI
jgi:ABC-type transporter Mla subunit MlaD